MLAAKGHSTGAPCVHITQIGVCPPNRLARLRERMAGVSFVVVVPAAAEPEPPHRLRGFRTYLVGSQVTDPRVAAPPSQSSGPVPFVATETAAAGFGELGLAGLVLAGGAPGKAAWTIARGWAGLDPAEPLRPGHRFPAYGVNGRAYVALTNRKAPQVAALNVRVFLNGS